MSDGVEQPDPRRDRLRKIRERHERVRTMDDGLWVCDECDVPWPCDAAFLLEPIPRLVSITTEGLTDGTTLLCVTWAGEHTFPAESCAVCAAVDQVIAFIDPDDPRGHTPHSCWERTA